MNESANSDAIIDEFEDFLDNEPHWEEVDEYVGEIHTEFHAAAEAAHCSACEELFDMADEVLDN